MDTLDYNQQNQIKSALYLVNFIDFKTEKQEFQKRFNAIYGEGNCPENREADIITRVINYLYSGIWDLTNPTLGKLPNPETLRAFGLATLKARINKFLKEGDNNDEIKQNLDEIKQNLVEINTLDIQNEFSAIIEKIRNNWHTVFYAHNKHLSSFIESFQVSKILVYEAPPYQADESSNINYLLLDDASGSYVTAIKTYSQPEINSNDIAEILRESKVLFFDLLMMPIPLSSDVRKSWFDKNCFFIEDKPLPVYLFEMNLKYLISKKINFTASPNFAIGTPHLTALPIFKYYSSKTGVFHSSLRATNDIETRQIAELGRLVLPLFKACFVNASNNPDGNLLKLAFGKLDQKTQ